MVETVTAAATAADGDSPTIHGHIALSLIRTASAPACIHSSGDRITCSQSYRYSVIQALQVGLGVLLGAYIMSWIADRYGRRPAILMSTLLGGLFLWPFAHVFDFWPLVVRSVLSTLGVGGIVATHAVYLLELIAPNVRSYVLLASQGSPQHSSELTRVCSFELTR